jgi:hypothetical protein
MKEPSRLSYSSLNSYAECGERWRLERGHKLNKSTWFATIAGSAVHAITEAIDLDELGLYQEGYSAREDEDLYKIYNGEIPTFKQEFDRLLDIEEENGVKVKPSGKVAKSITLNGGPNKKDYDWWLTRGPEMIEAWMEWKVESGYTIATMPDGTPGVEVVLDVPFADEKQLGFIDRVMFDSDGELVIIDLKMGDLPKSKLQLGNYKVALERKYGIRAKFGAYWMGKDGQLTPLTDLSVYTAPYLDSLYGQVWKGIRAGVFLPNVTSMCNGCGVKDYCRAVGGNKAITIPLVEVVEPLEVRQDTGVASH